MILSSAQKYRMLISEFIRYSMIEDGYRKITLEEITDNLAISKKTIYKVYPSKNELTRSVMMSELSDAYQNLILLLQEKSTISTEKRFLTRSKLDFRNLFQSIFTVLLTGILTKKGKKLLAINQRIKNENN